MHHKENETKTQSCTTVLSSQITLVSPRLGAEKGVGRTTVFFFFRPADDAICEVPRWRHRVSLQVCVLS